MTKPDAPLVAIVDDDPKLLESLGDLLESAGYGVSIFSSAGELLGSPDFKRIACLVTDIDIPLVDGFELRHLAHAIRPDLPIIFITAKADVARPGGATTLARDRLFQKPFDSQALLAAIAAALGNNGCRK